MPRSLGSLPVDREGVFVTRSMVITLGGRNGVGVGGRGSQIQAGCLSPGASLKVLMFTGISWAREHTAAHKFLAVCDERALNFLTRETTFLRAHSPPPLLAPFTFPHRDENCRAAPIFYVSIQTRFSKVSLFCKLCIKRRKIKASRG